MKRATERSAGYDLVAKSGGTLMPGRRILIPTMTEGYPGPKDTWGMIECRSGLASKYGLIRLAGVIDEDYDRNVGFLVYNSGDIPWTWEQGDRVAQLVFHPFVGLGDAVLAARVGGFGSTDNAQNVRRQCIG